MKFVSRYARHAITYNGGTRQVILSPSGVTEFIDRGDLLQVQFDLRTLTPYEIDAAKEQLFNAGQTPGVEGQHHQAFGSMPSRDEGLINVEEGLAAGYADLNYQPYDVYQNLGSYDTAEPTQCPPEHREGIESFLLNHNEFGTSFVRVDNYNLAPPWPRYPMGDTVNVADVVRFAKVGGLVEQALAYERATVARPELVALLEEAFAQELEEEREKQALTARV